MRLSELSERSGLPTATLKFYLREGLLPPGRAVSRTQAEYNQTHVERVRLLRALVEVGGLDLAAVRRVLGAIDDPAAERLGLMDVASNALEPPVARRGDDDRARRWVATRGWRIDPAEPLLGSLAAAWQACDEAALGLDEGRMNTYADAMQQVARVDVDSVPHDPAGAVRQVVLGTVLVDKVLVTLRRLAQQHVAVSAPTPPPDKVEP